MRKILLFIFHLSLTACCNSGTKRDWFSHEAEILPVKTILMHYGLEGGDHLTNAYQAIINGKKESLKIDSFDEFKLGTSYKVILRGYTDVRCGMRDAAKEVRYYKVEKTISTKLASDQTCFNEYIPSSLKVVRMGQDPKYLYEDWRESISKNNLQISKEDSVLIRNHIGKNGINYRVCILDAAKSKFVIDSVLIRP